jgi:beta-phosphoglucomutase-like phosphatase (HAD superfamily)
MTRLALFDLDGTLIPGDSDHAFGEFMVQLGWVDAEAHRRANDAFYAQYQAGTLDIDAYIAFTTGAWRARPLAEQAAASRRFITEVMQPQLLPPAYALLRQHQQAGDLVAIVTATNEFITRPIADAWACRICWPCACSATRRAAPPAASTACRHSARARSPACTSGWPNRATRCPTSTPASSTAIPPTTCRCSSW